MGNTKSYHDRKVSTPSFPGQWIPSGKTDYCQLVKNTRTGIIAQQYHIPLDLRITKQQNQEIYQQRRLQHDNLVIVYHIQKQTNQYLCQGKDFIIVKTQRIPYRLSEMNNLSFIQSLYILREAMIGYRAITDYYGPVTITDQMIGFTSDHRVKVWLNQEFAYNLPRQNAQFLQREPLDIQQKLPNTITQLFSVVEQHCQNGQFPQPFSKAYRQYPIQTFTEALEFIQDYANKKGLNLRNSLSTNSVVSAKTDYSLKQGKDKNQLIAPVTKPSFTSTLTINPSSFNSAPVALASPAQFKMKVAEPKLFNQVQPKKYYIVPGVKPTERKFVTLTEKSKDYKLEFDKKPSSNFTSTVSSNSNTIGSVRKVSQTGNHQNHQGVYKLFSPKDPKVTFTPTTGLKIPKPSQKTAPSEFNFGQTKIITSPVTIKPQEGVRYPIGQSYINNPSAPITFKQINKLWSPNKQLSRERKLPQKIINTKQLEIGLKSKYEKLSSESKSTVSGNIKVQSIPKTISFNYLKGSKPPVKIETK